MAGVFSPPTPTDVGCRGIPCIKNCIIGRQYPVHGWYTNHAQTLAYVPSSHVCVWKGASAYVSATYRSYMHPWVHRGELFLFMCVCVTACIRGYIVVSYSCSCVYGWYTNYNGTTARTCSWYTSPYKRGYVSLDEKMPDRSRAGTFR